MICVKLILAFFFFALFVLSAVRMDHAIAFSLSPDSGFAADASPSLLDHQGVSISLLITSLIGLSVIVGALIRDRLSLGKADGENSQKIAVLEAQMANMVRLVADVAESNERIALSNQRIAEALERIRPTDPKAGQRR